MPETRRFTKKPWNLKRLSSMLYRRELVLLILGIAAVVYVYTSHLPQGVLRAPLSSTNMLRLVLIGSFFILAVFWRVPGYVLFQRTTQVLVPISAMLVVVYVATDVTGADGLARGDRLIEDFSFLFLIVAALAMLMAGAQLLRRQRRIAPFLAFVLALVFVVIGMEEVSWFQHMLDYESSEFFRENSSQGETNLHNLYTHESEDIFYLGGFLLLVAMPFFRQPLEQLLEHVGMASLHVLLPASWLLVPFAIAGAFVPPFFVSRSANVTIALGSIVILIGFVHHAWSARELMRGGAALFTLVLFVGFIAFFLSFDLEGRGVRPWLGKEYQEFYISWGIFAYAISVLCQVATVNGAKPTALAHNTSSTAA